MSALYPCQRSSASSTIRGSICWRSIPCLICRRAAAGAMQADLSIRGATFGQTLVLLNGLRLDDVQTGHFNLDLPIPIEMLSGIEVLKGSGSTLYGSDAIGGVVNALTAPIAPGEFRLLAGAGNFGFNEQHAVASFGRSWWQEEMAAARDFSSGFTTDRDYRNLSLSSLTTLKSRLGATSLLFAYSDRPFGANDFYGAEQEQWERTKSWFTSGHQSLGDKTEANFAFRKHTDLYVYIRDDPSYYTNWHTDESWQGNLRRTDRVPLHGAISYGVEGLAESVRSTNLGVHSRERGSGYVFYDLRSVRRYSLSAGVREEVYGGRQVATSPSLSGAVWASAKFKVRASASRAFRLPSYTDLYYASPSTLGNPKLKPESATSYEGGADAYLKPNLRLSFTAFERRDSGVIDYVETPGPLLYEAENLPALHYRGVEASAVWEPRAGQHITLSFSGLHGQFASPETIVTEYAFNYPVYDGVMEWNGTLTEEGDRAQPHRGRGARRARPLRHLGCFARVFHRTCAAVPATDEYHEHGLPGHPAGGHAHAGRDRRNGIVRVRRLALGFGDHRQLGGFPGGQATGHLDQMSDPVLMQDAGGDGRAVAARAMDRDAPIARNLGDALLQMVQWNVHAAINMFRQPLARISDIEQQRRVGAR